MGRKAASKGRELTDAVLRGRQDVAGPHPRRPERTDRKCRRLRNTKQTSFPACSAVPPAPSIVDDFGEALSVTVQELNVIETYLGALLNELIER